MRNPEEPHPVGPALPVIFLHRSAPGVWHGKPVNAGYEDTTAALLIGSGARTDWISDAITGKHMDSAPALLFDVDGDFTLAADVTASHIDTFDAGVLCVRNGPRDWAKLCFERSPDGTLMVVSVVTRGASDDVNSTVIDGDTVRLRVARIGEAFAFHYSSDAGPWVFVRVFRLPDGSRARAGFLSQSPIGNGCTATFRCITWTSATLEDVRDGS